MPDRVAVDDGPLLYAAVTGGDTGIYVINTATSRVASVITDADDPQGIAISPSGSTLYVTNPDNGTLWQINAAIGHVIGTVSAGAEPQAVAVTPDGSQVWVGNGYTGSLSVISAVTNKVTTTISGGGQATALNSAITDIAFGPAS